MDTDLISATHHPFEHYGQCVAPYVHLYYLGSSLISVMVYLWARRNPNVRLSFLGVVTFTAPYLPWVFFGFTTLVSGRLAVKDLLGILVGHLYYCLDDVWPSMGGQHFLRSNSPPRRPPSSSSSSSTAGVATAATATADQTSTAAASSNSIIPPASSTSSSTSSHHRSSATTTRTTTTTTRTTTRRPHLHDDGFDDQDEDRTPLMNDLD